MLKNFPNLAWCQTPFTNIEINKDDALPLISLHVVLCVTTGTSLSWGA